MAVVIETASPWRQDGERRQSLLATPPEAPPVPCEAPLFALSPRFTEHRGDVRRLERRRIPGARRSFDSYADLEWRSSCYHLA